MDWEGRDRQGNGYGQVLALVDAGRPPELDPDRRSTLDTWREGPPRQPARGHDGGATPP